MTKRSRHQKCLRESLSHNPAMKKSRPQPQTNQDTVRETLLDEGVYKRNNARHENLLFFQAFFQSHKLASRLCPKSKASSSQRELLRFDKL